MPKLDNAPSQNWDVNNFISQSASINKKNNKEIEDYKAKTEAYKRIDATLSEYESQGINTTIYRKKLEEKVPELSLGEKLGVVGRNIGNDYVNSFAKIFGGTPQQSHTQKMDEVKQEREEAINPISTIAAEVALDPTTYAPIPFVKGSTKLTQFGKNAGVGAGVSGGTYTAKEYGDEDYKPIDSLLAAGFGGVLNGTIAVALGKTIPKTTKEAVTKKTVKESEPVADEAMQENFIDDDKIVNKIMNTPRQTEQSKKSIFGFDKPVEKESILGFDKTNQKPNNIPNAQETNLRVSQIQNDLNNIDEFEGITKAVGQNTSDVLELNKGTTTEGVRNAIGRFKNNTATKRDLEIIDAIKRYMNNEGNKAKEYINTPKNIDDALANNVDYETADKAGVIPFSTGGQTFGGGAVGGLESEFNQRDYNNDGKHTATDNLLGVLIGAVGINVAKKLMPKAFKNGNIDSDSIAGMLYPKGKPNFKLMGEAKTQYTKHNNPEMQQVEVGENIFANLNMLSNKRIKKLDENIKYYDTPEKMQHLIKKALGKPTHKLKDTKSGYNAITNTESKNNPTAWVDEDNSTKKWVKSAYNLRDEQLEDKMKASRGSVATQTAKSAPTSHDETIITKDITKSQDIKLNASPTISGGVVGATVGATNDLDQDGRITYKDLLYGTLAGAGGTKLAIKATDNIQGAKALTKLKKIVDTDFVDAFTGHKIYQKKDYMDVREKMISSKNAKMEDFVQLHEQLKLLSDDARANLHKYISGDNQVKLSDSLKKFGDNYINQIEKQGKELVDLGILDQAQYEKFKGKYLHRVYEKDLTKNISQSFGKGKTIPGVYTRGKEWTGTKTEYEQLLKDGEIGDFFQGKIEARKLNNGQYKFKQDWTLEQRAKWGEIEDIAYTLPETLMRMSEMAEHGKMLTSIAKQNKYLSDEALDGFVQLNGKRYGALKGKYVPKDIADDISEFNRSLFGEEDGAIFSKEVKDAFVALSTFWKKSHTVYNPTAHINNLMSNVTMQFMEGVNPNKAIINATKGAMAHRKLGEFRTLTAKTLVGLTKEEANKLKALSLDEDLQLYIQAEKAGLFGRSKLNDILGQYINPAKKKAKLKGLQKIDEVTSNYYQGEDNIMRFSLLKSLMDNGKNFDDAIKQVNNTIPDYTKPMSRVARFGRKSMLTPFISWTYYSTPIILRQFKERPERALAILGAMYGINKAFGIDPYDKKDIPQQNFSMKRIPIYKDGKEVTTLKVDRWMPHNEILSPMDFVRNLTNGGAWKGGYEVLNNQNLYYGGKITYNDGARKAYDIGKYATQQITPDAIDKVWNATESALLSKNKRKKHPVIQPRNTVQELLNSIGINTLTYDKQNQKKKVLRERLK